MLCGFWQQAENGRKCKARGVRQIPGLAHAVAEVIGEALYSRQVP